MLLFVSALLAGCNDQARFDAIDQQLSGINRKVNLLAGNTSLADPAAEPGDEGTGYLDELEQQLAEADKDGRKEIIQKELLRAANFKSVELATVEDLVDSMESLDIILSLDELDTELSLRVEDEQQRLIELLTSDVPAAVRQLDKQAVEADNYRTAQELWSEAGLLLEYFPSSNDPVAEIGFQRLAADHQEVAAQLESRQVQRYNQWACRQLKEAEKIVDRQTPDACVQTCLTQLGPIDPVLLSPLSLDVYSEFLEVVRKKLSLGAYIELAETLAVVPRKRLVDLRPGDREVSGR